MKKLLLYISYSFLVLFFYSTIVVSLVESDLPEIPGGVGSKTIFMLFFSIFHAWYLIGWKKMLMFFVITASVSWAFEQVGVETGLVYGKYHYTDYLGAKLGHVPVIIPLAWFMMIYPSYIIANFIFSGKSLYFSNDIWKIAAISLLSAAVMTAWDFVVDPYLSGSRVQAWVWEDGGPYFGIPIQNFIGWMLTTFTIYFIFRWIENKTSIQRTYQFEKFMLVPVLAYILMLVANLMPGDPKELIQIGPFIMGIPVLIAIIRIYQNKTK